MSTAGFHITEDCAEVYLDFSENKSYLWQKSCVIIPIFC